MRKKKHIQTQSKTQSETTKKQIFGHKTYIDMTLSITKQGQIFGYLFSRKKANKIHTPQQKALFSFTQNETLLDTI